MVTMKWFIKSSIFFTMRKYVHHSLSIVAAFKLFSAISRAPSLVSLPPIKPVEWQKTHPFIPAKSDRSWSLTPLQLLWRKILKKVILSTNFYVFVKILLQSKNYCGGSFLSVLKRLNSTKCRQNKNPEQKKHSQ